MHELNKIGTSTAAIDTNGENGKSGTTLRTIGSLSSQKATGGANTRQANGQPAMMGSPQKQSSISPTKRMRSVGGSAQRSRSSSGGRGSSCRKRGRSLSNDPDNQERAFVYPCQAFKQFLLSMNKGGVNINDFASSPHLMEYMSYTGEKGRDKDSKPFSQSLRQNSQPRSNSRSKLNSKSQANLADGMNLTRAKDSIIEEEEGDEYTGGRSGSGIRSKGASGAVGSGKGQGGTGVGGGGGSGYGQGESLGGSNVNQNYKQGLKNSPPLGKRQSQTQGSPNGGKSQDNSSYSMNANRAGRQPTSSGYGQQQNNNGINSNASIASNQKPGQSSNNKSNANAQSARNDPTNLGKAGYSQQQSNQRSPQKNANQKFEGGNDNISSQQKAANQRSPLKMTSSLGEDPSGDGGASNTKNRSTLPPNQRSPLQMSASISKVDDQLDGAGQNKKHNFNNQPKNTATENRQRSNQGKMPVGSGNNNSQQQYTTAPDRSNKNDSGIPVLEKDFGKERRSRNDRSGSSGGGNKDGSEDDDLRRQVSDGGSIGGQAYGSEQRYDGQGRPIKSGSSPNRNQQQQNRTQGGLGGRDSNHSRDQQFADDQSNSTSSRQNRNRRDRKQRSSIAGDLSSNYELDDQKANNFSPYHEPRQVSSLPVPLERESTPKRSAKNSNLYKGIIGQDNDNEGDYGNDNNDKGQGRGRMTDGGPMGYDYGEKQQNPALYTGFQEDDDNKQFDSNDFRSKQKSPLKNKLYQEDGDLNEQEYPEQSALSGKNNDKNNDKNKLKKDQDQYGGHHNGSDQESDKGIKQDSMYNANQAPIGLNNSGQKSKQTPSRGQRLRDAKGSDKKLGGGLNQSYGQRSNPDENEHHQVMDVNLDSGEENNQDNDIHGESNKSNRMKDNEGNYNDPNQPDYYNSNKQSPQPNSQQRRKNRGKDSAGKPSGQPEYYSGVNRGENDYNPKDDNDYMNEGNDDYDQKGNPLGDRKRPNDRQHYNNNDNEQNPNDDGNLTNAQSQYDKIHGDKDGHGNDNLPSQYYNKDSPSRAGRKPDNTSSMSQNPRGDQKGVANNSGGPLNNNNNNNNQPINNQDLGVSSQVMGSPAGKNGLGNKDGGSAGPAGYSNDSKQRRGRHNRGSPSQNYQDPMSYNDQIEVQEDPSLRHPIKTNYFDDDNTDQNNARQLSPITKDKSKLRNFQPDDFDDDQPNPTGDAQNNNINNNRPYLERNISGNDGLGSESDGAGAPGGLGEDNNNNYATNSSNATNKDAPPSGFYQGDEPLYQKEQKKPEQYEMYPAAASTKKKPRRDRSNAGATHKQAPSAYYDPSATQNAGDNNKDNGPQQYEEKDESNPQYTNDDGQIHNRANPNQKYPANSSQHKQQPNNYDGGIQDEGGNPIYGQDAQEKFKNSSPNQRQAQANNSNPLGNQSNRSKGNPDTNQNHGRPNQQENNNSRNPSNGGLGGANSNKSNPQGSKNNIRNGTGDGFGNGAGDGAENGVDNGVDNGARNDGGNGAGNGKGNSLGPQNKNIQGAPQSQGNYPSNNSQSQEKGNTPNRTNFNDKNPNIKGQYPKDASNGTGNGNIKGNNNGSGANNAGNNANINDPSNNSGPYDDGDQIKVGPQNSSQGMNKRPLKKQGQNSGNYRPSGASNDGNGTDQYEVDLLNNSNDKGNEQPPATKLKELEKELKDQIAANPSKPLNYALLLDIQQEAAKAIQQKFREHLKNKKPAGNPDVVKHQDGTKADRTCQTDPIIMGLPNDLMLNDEKFKKFMTAMLYSYKMVNNALSDQKK